MSSPSASYNRILKSTTLMGGASVVNVLLGIVRTKALAVLLGPGGVGLMGIYQSVMTLATNVSGLGINRSGVRQIAEAAGGSDESRIAATVLALRKTGLVLAVGGVLVMLALSAPISYLTFGSTQNWPYVALLGLAVGFTQIAGAQEALVQGLRRVGDLAKIRIFGATLGTALGIPIVWYWGERGVVGMFVAVAAAGLLNSWLYSRRVRIREASVNWGRAFVEARELLRLGLAFMASGLVAAGSVYLIRLILIRSVGLEGAGYYTASYTLAGVYASFILQAMGSDFYPRLTAAAAHADSECNRLVNEQVEIGLLVAVPGLIATVGLAPLIIDVFYSSKFGPSVGILQWQVLGVLGQVASWPMGYVVLAKGRGRLFFACELISNSVHMLLIWWCVRRFGLPGAGLAFFGLYVFQCGFVYGVARRLTGFRLSGEIRRIAAWLAPVVAGVFLCSWVLPSTWAFVAGILFTGVAAVFSLRALSARVDTRGLQARYNRLRSRLGLASGGEIDS